MIGIIGSNLMHSKFSSWFYLGQFFSYLVILTLKEHILQPCLIFVIGFFLQFSYQKILRKLAFVFGCCILNHHHVHQQGSIEILFIIVNIRFNSINIIWKKCFTNIWYTYFTCFSFWIYAVIWKNVYWIMKSWHAVYVVFQRGISIRITSVIVMLMNYLLYVIMCVITHRNFIQGSPPPTPLSTPGG